MKATYIINCSFNLSQEEAHFRPLVLQYGYNTYSTVHIARPHYKLNNLGLVHIQYN